MKLKDRIEEIEAHAGHTLLYYRQLPKYPKKAQKIEALLSDQRLLDDMANETHKMMDRLVSKLGGWSL